MSISLKCPKCEEEFKRDKSDLYQMNHETSGATKEWVIKCPKCDTRLRCVYKGDEDTWRIYDTTSKAYAVKQSGNNEWYVLESRSGGGCLVFIAALGTLLSSGVCGLALFIMLW